MCDTWVAMPDATISGQVILAKNSDRPIYDAQPLLFFAQQSWPAGSMLPLEHVAVPQAQVTYATLGSSPYWCWGYEEGINEHSVVVGNEAIPTKTFRHAAAQHRQDGTGELGLLGMDLVRLALERSRTARAAVEFIGALVEQYGQFGSAVPARPHDLGGYDNSFLVADPHEAWVVEAAGRRWLARRFDHGATSISNQPTIRTTWDLGSPDVVDYAVEMGWWPAELDHGFDFARAYGDDCIPRQVSQIRLMRSRQLLAQQLGQITPKWMKRIARDHYEDTFLQGPYFDAADPDFHTLCMHSSAAGFTWGNTASSCIAVLPRSPSELPVFWWTPGPPCNGCYVPFFVHGNQLPAVVSAAGAFGKRIVAPDAAVEDTFSPDSYWWLFRELLDRAKGDPNTSVPGLYPARNQLVRARFDALEYEFETQTPAVMREALAVDRVAVRAAILDDFTQRCVHKVHGELQELLSAFS